MHRRSMVGHRTSTSLRLSDSYSCELGFVCRYWLLSSSFECLYVAFDLLFPFPKSNSVLQYRHDGRRRPTSIVDLTARVPCRFFTFAEHVSFEHSIGSSRPMITSRREGNINRQNSKVSSHSYHRSVSPLRPACVRAVRGPRPVRSSSQRRDFLSNRKYRYRPHTQADVTDCWPCAYPGLRLCFEHVA